MALDATQDDTYGLPPLPLSRFLSLPLELRLHIYYAMIGNAISVKKRQRRYKDSDGTWLSGQYKIADSALQPAVRMLQVCKQINSELRDQVLPKISLDLSQNTLILQSVLRRIDWLTSLINSAQSIICSVHGARGLFEHHRGFDTGEAWFSCQSLRMLVIIDTSDLLFALTQPEPDASRLLSCKHDYILHTKSTGSINGSHKVSKLNSLRLALDDWRDRGPTVKIRSQKKALKGREIEFSSPNRVVVRGIQGDWVDASKHRLISVLGLPESTNFRFEHLVDQPVEVGPAWSLIDHSILTRER